MLLRGGLTVQRHEKNCLAVHRSVTATNYTENGTEALLYARFLCSLLLCLASLQKVREERFVGIRHFSCFIDLLENLVSLFNQRKFKGRCEFFRALCCTFGIGL